MNAQAKNTTSSAIVKRPRRTQAERSAATRQVLLQAAIKCLSQHGYGMTTTIEVAELAGVSRGAMLHQFPSKADLMTFVVEEVFKDEVVQYSKMLKGIDDPRERLLAYPLATFKLQSRPAGVAVLEILQGSRSDRVLAKKLKPVQMRIEKSAIAALESEFPGGVSIPMLQLVVGVARGLAVSQVISPAKNSNNEAIALFQELIKLGIRDGLMKSLRPQAAT